MIDDGLTCNIPPSKTVSQNSSVFDQFTINVQISLGLEHVWIFIDVLVASHSPICNKIEGPEFLRNHISFPLTKH